MARALKTFCYSDGFHAWTVATTSRAKALEALGMKRDLFKDGFAREIDSGPDREAALKSPGELIKRGLLVDVDKVIKAASPKAPKADGNLAKARARVETLEAALDALDAAQAAETEAVNAQREALEEEADAVTARQAKAREGLKGKLKAARAKA